MIRVLVLALLSLFIMSCDKDEATSSKPLIQESIIPLEIGNYWIYQTYSEDADGVFQPKSNLDSIFIESTVNIDGQEYFVFNKYSFGLTSYSLRDSSGYLLNPEGQILYSPNDDDGILYEVIYNLQANNTIVSTFEMEGSSEVETLAGVFGTRKVVGTYDFSQSSFDCDKKFIKHYAEGVGIVREDAFFASDCGTIYKELVRYNTE